MVEAKPPAAPPARDTTPFKFSYKPHAQLKAGRGITKLVRSDLLISLVQTFPKGGGEYNLHSHDALDGFWFVLSGRALFYDENDKITGDLGPNEGMFIPRTTPYWFEQAGEDPLVILQVEAVDKSAKNRMQLYREVQLVDVDRYAEDGTYLSSEKVNPMDHAEESSL